MGCRSDFVGCAGPVCVIWVPQHSPSDVWGSFGQSMPQANDHMKFDCGNSVNATSSDGSENSLGKMNVQKKHVRRGARGGRRHNSAQNVEILPSSEACSKSLIDPSDEDVLSMSVELMSKIEAGGPEALDSLYGRVKELSFDKSGCRVVQAAIEMAPARTATKLATELKGSIRRAVKCPNANYVVQKIVQHLPPSLSGFVVDELLGSAVEMSKHGYACRVLCRLLEHHTFAGQFHAHTAALVAEILNGAPELLRHNFGHYVLQVVMEHGDDCHRSQLFSVLAADILENACHKSAAYVVEKALVFCSPSQQRSMACGLMKDSEGFVAFASSLYGWRVASALLRVQDLDLAQQVQMFVSSKSSQLQTSKYGRRLLEEMRRCKGCWLGN